LLAGWSRRKSRVRHNLLRDARMCDRLDDAPDKGELRAASHLSVTVCRLTHAEGAEVDVFRREARVVRRALAPIERRRQVSTLSSGVVFSPTASATPG
jgi:hypothetical protein